MRTWLSIGALALAGAASLPACSLLVDSGVGKGVGEVCEHCRLRGALARCKGAAA